MAHVLLPSAGPGEDGRNDQKYADVVVPKLIRRMRRGLPEGGELIVKIAGGANMLPSEYGDNSIGARNVKEIRRLLDELGCIITAEDVLGIKGRTIRFHVATGDVDITYTGLKYKSKKL